MKKIKLLLRDSKKLLFIYLVMSLLVSLLDVGLAVIMAVCVDVATGERFGNLFFYAGAFVLYIAVFYITYLNYRRLLYRIDQIIRSNIKNGMVEQVFQQNSNGKTQRNSGEWVSVFTTDIDTCSQSYVQTLLLTIPDMVALIVSSILMIWVSPILFFMILGITIFQMIIPKYMGEKMLTAQMEFSSSAENFTKTLSEHLQARQTMTAFGLSCVSKEMVKEKSEQLERDKFALHFLRARAQMAAMTMGNFSYIGLFFVGAILILKGHLTVGELIGASQLAVYITGPMQTISESVAEIKGAKLPVQKLHSLMGDENKKEEVFSCIGDKNVHQICLNHVSFGYGEKQILEDVSLCIEKGQNYLIKAPSGSGKSTLAGLIAGRLTPESGTVTYDGIDISKCKREDIAKICLAMPQETFIFQDSLVNNISLYREAYSKDRINEIIQTVGLNKMRNDSDALILDIAQAGANVSGGELQRIAIARMLLSDADYMILDESMANLDLQSAQEILQILTHCSGKSILYITHEEDARITNLFSNVIQVKDRKVIIPSL